MTDRNEPHIPGFLDDDMWRGVPLPLKAQRWPWISFVAAMVVVWSVAALALKLAGVI